MSLSASVRVPATTANIGPGFDCLGAALNLYNHFTFTAVSADEPRLTITATGLEADLVSTAADNLVYKAFLHLYEHLELQLPPLKLEIELHVPLSRGLGSSATAIVGGLVGANAIAGSPLSPLQILDLAIALEGHPDNVAPALLGGCQLSTQPADGPVVLCPITWAEDLVPVLAIPDFELPTHEARTVLPGSCSYQDAIFNASHLGLLVKGLEAGEAQWLQAALSDRLHQPYRTQLIQGYDEVRAAALDAGAYGLVISGAGPSLLAICPQVQAEAVSQGMKRAWQQAGVKAQVQTLALDQAGTQISQVRAQSLLT